VNSCDVVIVGGGPAGSSCAWKLGRAGFDVVVVDAADFPRDKVCAGWIAPEVIADLEIDPDDYRAGRTFQPITGFRVGTIGGGEVVEAEYGRAVSYGIRRCEFDDYLLRRSGARLVLGAPVRSLRRSGSQWVVDDAVRAPMLVGAGGHFCPVSRLLNRPSDRALLVAAQEVELAIDERECAIGGERPELYFCPDLTGYGWCFRKGAYVNIGLGRVERHELPKATRAFVDFLGVRRRLRAGDRSWRWRGHAYLLSGSPDRRAVGDAVLLAGDAAGLAHPRTGEGILPAIESGLLAASAIVDANGRYDRARLEPYAARLRARFGAGAYEATIARMVPAGVVTALGRRLLAESWFVRHVVLDRWFLHGAPALSSARRPTPLPTGYTIHH
jgi:geranylgeranyl reductase family protein